MEDIKDVLEIPKRMARFTLKAFGVGAAAGMAASLAFAEYMKRTGGWDQSVTPFQIIVLFAALAISIPGVAGIVRMTWQGLALGVRGHELLWKTSLITDRAATKMEDIANKVSKYADDGLVDDLREGAKALRETVRPAGGRRVDRVLGAAAFQSLSSAPKGNGNAGGSTP